MRNDHGNGENEAPDDEPDDQGVDEDVIPPPGPKSTAKDAYDYVRMDSDGGEGVKPVTTVGGESGLGGAVDSGDKGLNSLAAVAGRTFFFDYFVHVAERRYGGQSRAPKVRKLISDSRRFYQAVVAADLILRGLTLALFIAGVALLFIKALWPIVPGFEWPDAPSIEVPWIPWRT